MQTETTMTNSPQSAVDQLSEAYLKAVMSLGEDSVAILKKHIARSIELQGPMVIADAINGFSLIERHAHDHKPDTPGIYLKLLHGRAPLDAEMDDWGEDGPWIGPMEWIHFTYQSSFSIGFVSGEEYWSGASESLPPTALYCHQDCIYFDGVYYGDWEFQTVLNQQGRCRYCSEPT